MCGSTTAFSSNNIGLRLESVNFSLRLRYCRCIFLPVGNFCVSMVRPVTCATQIDVLQVAKCFVRNKRVILPDKWEPNSWMAKFTGDRHTGFDQLGNQAESLQFFTNESRFACDAKSLRCWSRRLPQQLLWTVPLVNLAVNHFTSQIGFIRFFVSDILRYKELAIAVPACEGQDRQVTNGVSRETSHGSVEKCHSNLKDIGKAEMLNACIASKVCYGFLHWLSCEVWNLESAVVTWISCSLSRRSTWTAAVSCAVKRSCLLALTRQAATEFCGWTWHRGFPESSSRMNFWFLWCFFQLRFMLQSYANTEAVSWWVATYPTVIASGKRCITFTGLTSIGCTKECLGANVSLHFSGTCLKLLDFFGTFPSISQSKAAVQNARSAGIAAELSSRRFCDVGERNKKDEKKAHVSCICHTYP